MNQTDEKCFIEIFTEYGKGLYNKYIYLLPHLISSEDKFKEFMIENENYYMYEDEIQLINENKTHLAELIGSNTNIIDLGPGSDVAVENKTLNALSCMSHISSYTAIDIEQSYALNAASLVHKRYPKIITSAIYADMMNEENVEQLSNFMAMKNKTIFSFNCMIHNLTLPLIDKLFSNLAKLLNSSDLLILGLDTNQDSFSLLKSYEKSANMSLDIMRYFNFKLKVSDFDPEAFSVKPEIQKDETNNLTYIKFNAVATRKQSFEFKGQTFEIREGDVYYLWHSLRCNTEFIKNIGSRHGFVLREVIQNVKNRLKLFVLVKF